MTPEQIIDQLLANLRTAESLRPLRPIMGAIGGQPATAHYFSPGVLSVKENPFATRTERPVVEESDLLGLANELPEDTAAPDSAAVYTAYHLAHKYGARVASVQGGEDAALFDQNRLAVARSVCDAAGASGDQPYLLIKGDLSGIQPFIYHDIRADQANESRKLAKLLRGRSFFVALLAQSLAELLVERLDLALPNVVFSGGGSFLVLAPNTDQVRSELQSFTATVYEQLARRLSYAPALTIASVPAGAAIFTAYGAYSVRLADELDRRKQRQHDHYLSEVMPPRAYEPEADSEQNPYQEARQSTARFQELGRRIVYANYLLEIHVKPEQKERFEKWLLNNNDRGACVITALGGFGRYYFLAPNWKEERDFFSDLLKGPLALYARGARLIRLNDTDFLRDRFHFTGLDFTLGFGFRFIGNHAPKQESDNAGREDLLTFEEMAERGYDFPRKLSYDRLGVLRLDVDDLGAIFAAGLGQDSDFARVATLSREMQFFFAGYLNDLAKQYNIYVVYSGGDDAFFVGSWYDTLHFARAVREDFDRFTTGNSAVTFSAGIFVCSPYYPVARFYREAGDLEGEAKHCGVEPGQPQTVGKNAIAVFGQVYPWSRYDEMLNKGTNLLQLVNRQGETMDADEKGRFRRSLIHRLLRYIQANRDRTEVDAFESYRSIAQLHYLLARHKIPGGSLIGEFVRDSSRDNGRPALDYVLPFTYVYHLSKER